MKKTLLAVAIPALLASGAASATTIYDNNGTKIDIKGQFRVALEYSDARDDAGEDGTKFRDLGSRFGFAVKHDLGDGLYGLGEFEWGNDTQQRENSFTLKNRLAYAGMGLDGVGEFTIGRVLSPFDNVHLTEYNYEYGHNLEFGHSILNPKGRTVGGTNSNQNDNFIGRVSNTAKFMSADFNGFSFGGTYTTQTSGDDWEQLGRTRNAYTLAAFYDSGFGLQINAGYGHAKMKDGTFRAGAAGEYTWFPGFTSGAGAADVRVSNYTADIWGIGTRYTIDSFSIAFDFGQAKVEADLDQGLNHYKYNPKVDLYGFGAKYNIDKSNIYVGYYFSDGNSKADVKEERKAIVGADYQFTPSFRAYVEYANVDVKEVRRGSQEDENKGLIGLRVYF